MRKHSNETEEKKNFASLKKSRLYVYVFGMMLRADFGKMNSVIR